MTSIMENVSGGLTKICPVCKNMTSCSDSTLSISFPEYEGEHCMKCWAKWISENIPKLVEFKEENEN